MAVALADESAKLKADLLAAKKRASDLQGDADRFAVERKQFQELQEAKAAADAALVDAKVDSEELAAQLKDAEGELAKANKLLAKALAQNSAAQKIKEGLAELD